MATQLLSRLRETFWFDFEVDHGRSPTRRRPWRSIISDLRGGPKRNFQVFSVLDFLAEVTQHIPDKGEHLVRYYGWYSSRQRGIRKKRKQAGQAESDKLAIDRSALNAQPSAAREASPRSMSTWVRLIKRVYEVDPLQCPCCGGQMKIVSCVESCQAEVIERILQQLDEIRGEVGRLRDAVNQLKQNLERSVGWIRRHGHGIRRFLSQNIVLGYCCDFGER